MLNKLVGLIQSGKTSHPLGSPEMLAHTLGEIPLTDAGRVLAETDNLIEDVQRYEAELTPSQLLHAVLEIDGYGRKSYTELLCRFLTPGTRDCNSDILWAQFERHQRLLQLAYEHCLRLIPAGTEQATRDRDALTLATVRAMQAWVEYKRLQHFRYRPPELEWWLTAHQLVALASHHGTLSQTVVAYPEEKPPRSCLHAYLVGLYLEMAPVANLVPVQLEVLHGWLQQHAATVEFSELPNPGTTHYISLHNPGQPTLYSNHVTPNASLRFCSTRRLRSMLLQLSKQVRRQEAPPDWLQPYLTQRDELEGLLNSLLRYWADQRPERASARVSSQQNLRVVQGFALARRMIACSAFAREGKTLRYRRADWEQLFAEQRFGRVDMQLPATEDEAPADPMETLQKLETAGDIQMMEHWTLADCSNTGIGAIASGLRSRNRIGELIAFRLEDDIEWCIGVIRRIGRDSRRRASIGLETWPLPVVCAQGQSSELKTGDWQQANAQGFFDAILLAGKGDELLLPPAVFAVNLKASLNVGGKQRRIVVTEKIERGGDWVHARFRPDDEETQ